MVRKMGLFLLTVVSLLSVATVNSQAQSVLTRHVREVCRNGKARYLRRLSKSQILQLDIVLPLRDQAGLNSLLKGLYDPASPTYRHFLTVSEFSERFGPTQKDYDAVVRFAKSKGFAVIGGTRDGMNVQVIGPVSTVNSAFHLIMGVYQHPSENRTFYGPESEPTTKLKFPLWHIAGLDNYSIPHPLFIKKNNYAKAHSINPEDVGPYATTGSGPSGSFLGSDMRAAYYGGTALTGAGQNMGLVEYAGTDLDDLTTYFRNIGQTNNVPVSVLSTDGTSTSCVDTSAGGNCDDTEQTLDMTQAIGMAPGLASLVEYVGSTDTAIISAMTTSSPLPTTIGCSWGWTPADTSTLDPYFERMAAQGQNFFVASGDNSTWSSTNEAWPADDANVVSVGGTDLITAGPAGPWQSETAWSSSGGGVSPDGIPIPSWQQIAGVINSSNQGSTTLRNGPDVSANANFTFYVCADQTTCTANEYGGTSFAAPMWAAYIALANQQLVANDQPTLGFLDPILYAQNVTSSYNTDFHDIISGTSGSYSAVPGYDLVTGWGTPNGSGGPPSFLINAPAPALTVSSSPASLSVARGSFAASTITTAITRNSNSAIRLSVSGEPSGETVTLSPSSITGSGSGTWNMTVQADRKAPIGSHVITITATDGNAVQSANVAIDIKR